MKINFAKRAIELTKTEAQKASVYGTEEYETLIQCKRDYPDYRITVVKSRVKRDNLRGLNRDFMGKYISERDDENKSVLKEFYTLCGLDEKGKKKDLAAVASYGELRMWFLSKYPEILDMQDTIDEIINEARAAKEKREREKNNIAA